MASQATMMRSLVLALLMALLATSVRVDEDPAADAATDADADAAGSDNETAEVDPEEEKKKAEEQESLVKAAGHMGNAANLSKAVSKKAVEKAEQSQIVLDNLAKEQAEALTAAQKTKDHAIAESERAERAEMDKKVKDASYKKACKESKKQTAMEVVGRASAMAAAAAEAKVTEEYANVDSEEVEALGQKDTSDAKADVAIKTAEKAAITFTEADKHAKAKATAAEAAAAEEQERVPPMKAAQAARAKAKKTMRASAETERIATEEAGVAFGNYEKAKRAQKEAAIKEQDAMAAQQVTSKKASKEKAAADEASEFAAAGAQVTAEREAKSNGAECLQQK